MRLNALERRADHKLTLLIQKLMNEAAKPIVIDDLVMNIYKKTRHYQKTLGPAYFREKLRSKMRALTKPHVGNEDQFDLFPDLKFIPNYIMVINEAKKRTLVDLMDAKLSEYRQWMTLQIIKNRRSVEAKEAHYRNFLNQFIDLEERYGDTLPIRDLMAILRSQASGGSATGTGV